MQEGVQPLDLFLYRTEQFPAARTMAECASRPAAYRRARSPSSPQVPSSTNPHISE
jgi:hypothetical protein